MSRQQLQPEAGSRLPCNQRHCLAGVLETVSRALRWAERRFRLPLDIHALGGQERGIVNEGI